VLFSLLVVGIIIRRKLTGRRGALDEDFITALQDGGDEDAMQEQSLDLERGPGGGGAAITE